MKALVLMALLGSAAPALAAPSIHLNCHSAQTLIYRTVDEVVVSGDQLEVHFRDDGDHALVDQGSLTTTTNLAATFQMKSGTTVSLPIGLMKGMSVAGSISFSTYDYPYESAFCRSQP